MIGPVRDRWEALETRVQAAIALPVLLIFFFFLNLVPFSQPLGSSVLYAVIEGGLFTAFLLLATRAEKARRDGSGP